MNRRSLLSLFIGGLASICLPRTSSAQTGIPKLGAPFPSGWKIDKSATVFDSQSPRWDHVRRRVFDASFVELHKVIRCNTETGEIEKFKTDSNGELAREFIIGFGMGIAKERTIALAPLTVLRPGES